MRRLIISSLGWRRARTAGETFAGLFRTRLQQVIQRALMNWTSGGWKMVWASHTSALYHRGGTAEVVALPLSCCTPRFTPCSSKELTLPPAL